MALVTLPCYKGFTSIAVWPDPQNVSIMKHIQSIIYYIHSHKVTSIYGLLSTNPFLDKVENSHVITLPFVGGCKYVAYQAIDTEKVRQIGLPYSNITIFLGRDSHLV